MKGAVTKFDDKKGYGFIQPDGQSETIFVHASDVTTAGRLAVGQRVRFEITQSAKGPRAANVAVEGAAAAPPSRRGSSPVSPYWLFGSLAVFDTILVMALAMLVLSLSWLWAYLIAINLTTLMLYAYDKSVAGSGMVRVPEKILHAVELLGGTPAGIVGQHLLRHKRAKGSYQIVFWLIFFAQVGIVLVLFYAGLLG
jgi:cold shock CspA family protein/uncharacterized membrane protein YsdA (DUF1294 family)